MSSRLYKSNPDRLDMHFNDFLKMYDKYYAGLENKTVIELGPGNSLLTAMNFLMNGASKVILVDKFPRIDGYQITDSELEYIEKKYGRKAFFLDENKNISLNYLSFWEGDILELPSRGIDILYSVSVLEHVKEAEKVIVQLGKVCALGGCMYHKIDLRDHYNFEQPFRFYRYSDKLWGKFLTKEGLSFTNRIRATEFKSYFTKNGFELMVQNETKYSMLGVTIHPDLAKHSDLEIGGLELFLKKKESDE